MRSFIALATFLWVGHAVAGPAPSPPTDAQRAEIAALEQQLATFEQQQAPFAVARVARRLYDAQRKATGDDSPETSARRVVLAGSLSAIGDFAAAGALYRKELARTEAAHGVDSREALWAIGPLVGVAWSQARFDDIDPLVRRTLALTKKLDGEHSATYAQALSQYASLLAFHSEYSEAVRLYEQVVQIDESLGPKAGDLVLVSSLQLLASAYWLTNQQPRAIEIYTRVIGLIEAAPDATPISKAATISGIAAMYRYGGRKDLAGPLQQRVIDMFTAEVARIEQANHDDPQLPALLGQLGYTHQQNGDLAAAETALQRAVALDTKAGRVAGWAGVLADVEHARGKPKDALALLEQAKVDLTRLAPLNATVYDPTIATLLGEVGDHKRALAVLASYRADVEHRYGKRHPLYASAELATANALLSSHDTAGAERVLTESLDLAEHELANVLGTGTEADHEGYFARNGYLLDTAVNFAIAFAPTRPGAVRLGLTTLLRRKGRVLDAAAAAMATIRSKLSPDDKRLLDDLAAARNQLAKLTVAGPSAVGAADGYGKELATLEDQIQRLEIQVGTKSAAYRAVTQPIELAAIQKLIPRDTRLVEIVNYQPSDPTAPASSAAVIPPRRYAAYVVAATGDPAVFDLGPAAAIDAAVSTLRKALATPKSTNVADAGHALYALTIAKLVPALGAATDVLLAPDGNLNLVPFAALVDDQQQFLIKRYTFTYLTSGRDLLRLTLRTKAQGGGVMFANPAFDGTAPPAPAPAPAPRPGGSRGSRSMDLASLSWPQLPGTGEEADQVEATWHGFADYRGSRATETAVKALHGPKILHLATHGFFLSDKAAAGNAAVHEDPLLRSGLAFAGANVLSSGDDDGILTAMEASGLDLWGTKLVVLSACDTGNGKVTNGDGVYGLRRALVIAGAESLVMTLWQVDDRATRDLMAGYYRKLAAGRPRSSSLRDIQLELAARAEYAHPYYWASFLAAGDNSPL